MTLYPIKSEFDDGVKDFIASFYAISDIPGKHQEWLAFFDTDAVLVMGNDRAQGHESMKLILLTRVYHSENNITKICPH